MDASVHPVLFQRILINPGLSPKCVTYVMASALRHISTLSLLFNLIPMPSDTD